MHRRQFLRSAAVGLAAASSCASAPYVLKNKRPNLVFVLVDQLRTQSCGYFGGYADHAPAQTPNIDRLAAKGADFRNAVSTCPVCSPYRASLFSGKYQSSTGHVKNELRCLPDNDTIGNTLDRYGYLTHYLGKWHLDNQQYTPPGDRRLGFNQGWEAYNFNHNYYRGYFYRNTPDRISVDGYEPDVQTDMAIDFIDTASKSDAPFALFLSMGPPHKPWNWNNVPGRFADMFHGETFPDPPNYRDGHGLYWVPSWDEEWWMNSWKPYRHRYRQVYAAQTSSIDWNLGLLMQALDEKGLAEDTVLVFTSDHGEMSGSQGRLQKNIFYEEAARVPFLLHWKDQTPAQVHDACLGTVDIAPTLLGLLDLPIPDSMEGMNLSHTALGEAGPEPRYAVMTGMGHAYRWEDGWEWRAIRSRRHTFAFMLATGEEMLFDNIADPYQTHNLMDDLHEESVQQAYYFLKDRLYERLFALGDPLRSTLWYRDNWTEDGNVLVRSATRSMATAAERPQSGSPAGVDLHQNYPNPFRAKTTIRYQLDASTGIRLTIYDVMGRRVRMLEQSTAPAGTHSLKWDGADNAGRKLAGGTYLLRLETSDGTASTRRMTLLR